MRMKRSYFIAAIVAAAAGTALHFLYEVSPNLISALLSPVNESVWEHLKLLYWRPLRRHSSCPHMRRAASGFGVAF